MYGNKIVQRILKEHLGYEPYDDLTIYSPNNIMVLIQCYLLQPIERYEAAAVQEALKMPVKEGSNQMYETTPLGKAWLQAALNVAIPKSAFIDEQGRVIK